MMTIDAVHADTPSLKPKRSRSKSLVRARKRRLLQQRQPTPCVPRPSFRRPSLFETYIASQPFLHPSEHRAFFATLRRPLPVCFRIRSTQAAEEWRSLLRSLPQHDAASIHPLPLHALAYQFPSRLLDTHPPLRNWISSRTTTGNLSRQEYVSMIPVHLLGIQSHHKVLDLCASPGSKTIQALDALYDSQPERGDHVNETPSLPSGFVVANELHTRRAYILARRSKDTAEERTRSLAVVTHDARRFPNVLAPPRRGPVPNAADRPRPFDRIVCDVPCSGDGTLRKDAKIYKTWHPSYGMALHSLQLRIAKRGVALLKIGGYMTYSTSSFHPVENEAVVAALLATGCVELVEGTELVGPRGLEGLRYREGVREWKVWNDECQILHGEEDEGRTWPSTLWPPREEGIAELLKRCIRMVPQDNDTGGFFIALLKKIKDFEERGDGGRGSAKEAMVTSQMPFHRLYECLNVESRCQEECRYFVRSQGYTGDSKAKTFVLSPGLAEHLCDKPGSSKLNLVYAGHAVEPAI